MLHIMGDIHFSDLTAWGYEVGEKFLDWFSNELKSNPAEDTLLLEGDVFDREINAGRTMLQVKKFFDKAVEKYKKVIVIIGNHEVKLVHKVVQHPLMFLETYPKVQLIESIQAMDIDGIHSLLLPFMRFADGTLLYDFYAKTLPEFKGESFDLIAGHVNEKDPNNWLLHEGVELDGISAKHIAFGHIHTRITDHYTGSVWAVKISEEETPLPRQIQVLSKEGGELKVSGIDIPKFIHYSTLSYPDKPDTALDNKWCTNVYKVEGLASTQMAMHFYPGIYIHSASKGMDNGDQKDVTAADFEMYTDMVKALDDMITSTGKSYGRQTYSYVKALLENSKKEKTA